MGLDGVGNPSYNLRTCVQTLVRKNNTYFEELIHTLSIKIAQGVNEIYSIDGLFEF